MAKRGLFSSFFRLHWLAGISDTRKGVGWVPSRVFSESKCCIVTEAVPDIAKRGLNKVANVPFTTTESSVIQKHSRPSSHRDRIIS